MCFQSLQFVSSRVSDPFCLCKDHQYDFRQSFYLYIRSCDDFVVNGVSHHPEIIIIGIHPAEARIYT